MAFTFLPDYRFEKFDDITLDFLKAHGVRAVLLDIDNTLEPYENPIPGERVLNWLHMLSENGISAAIVSNNEWERVNKFNENIGLTAYAKSGKPFKKNLCLAMEKLGVSPSEALFVGDQVFTDVWAAHNAKIKAALVPPIKDKRNFITRFKRLLEKPVLRKYEKRKMKNEKRKDQNDKA